MPTVRSIFRGAAREATGTLVKHARQLKHLPNGALMLAATPAGAQPCGCAEYRRRSRPWTQRRIPEIAMDGYSGYVDALRRAGVAIADDIAARLDAK
jgi:hypothetical protein